MKKQTLEEVALSFLPNSEVEHDTDFIIGFEFGAKWQQEQAKEMEKEQMIKFAKHCLDKSIDLDILMAYNQVEIEYTNQTFKSE